MFNKQVNITLKEARERYPSFKAALEYIAKLHGCLDADRKRMLDIFPFLSKNAMEFMEYQHAQPMAKRDIRADRVFPLKR